MREEKDELAELIFLFGRVVAPPSVEMVEYTSNGTVAVGPFNPFTAIQFQLPEVGGQKSDVSHVTLNVLDVLGKEISTLVNEELPAGTYSINFDGNNLASGVYYYTLTSGGFIQTKVMVLMK